VVECRSLQFFSIFSLFFFAKGGDCSRICASVMFKKYVVAYLFTSLLAVHRTNVTDTNDGTAFNVTDTKHQFHPMKPNKTQLWYLWYHETFHLLGITFIHHRKLHNISRLLYACVDEMRHAVIIACNCCRKQTAATEQKQATNYAAVCTYDALVPRSCQCRLSQFYMNRKNSPRIKSRHRHTNGNENVVFNNRLLKFLVP
jgi:hypothetical protein